MNSGIKLLILLSAFANALPHALERNNRTGYFMVIVKRHLTWNANKDIEPENKAANYSVVVLRL